MLLGLYVDFSLLFFTVFKHQWFELKNCGSYAVVYMSPEFVREALFSKRSKVFSFRCREKSQKIATLNSENKPNFFTAKYRK
jgi:hypothetical protein